MRYLLLSDIHSNWEALQGVLADAAGLYQEIVCCGDFAGYAAEPNRVIDWAREHVRWAVRGNHDRAAAGTGDLEWFNPVAREATLWTRQELTRENREYLAQLPRGPLQVNGFSVSHGAPFDEDAYITTTPDALEVFTSIQNAVNLFGHTHVQGGFEWRRSRVSAIDRQLIEIEETSAYYLNPGSVGQPRDGDWRAAYAIYDAEMQLFAFGRAVYDIESAQRKIVEAGLPEALAERLREGR